MAVESVSKSTSSPVQLSRSQGQAGQAKQAVSAKRAVQRDDVQPALAPKPVVNTQGQTIGKLVNTSA